MPYNYYSIAEQPASKLTFLLWKGVNEQCGERNARFQCVEIEGLGCEIRKDQYNKTSSRLSGNPLVTMNDANVENCHFFAILNLCPPFPTIRNNIIFISYSWSWSWDRISHECHFSYECLLLGYLACKLFEHIFLGILHPVPCLWCDINSIAWGFSLKNFKKDLFLGSYLETAYWILLLIFYGQRKWKYIQQKEMV